MEWTAESSERNILFMYKSISDIVIIIPAYNPDEKMMDFLSDLAKAGYDKIIIIDDGSKSKTAKYFEQAEMRFGCDVIHHSINLGQGRAYKSGFNHYLLKANRGGIYENTIGIIQCDCDGQHKVEDVDKCVELLRMNPEKFILGVRDFSNRDIPFRSRFGNKCTNLVFQIFCGLDVKDTQTGLKGIPASFISRFIETPGERFEYASSVLLETKRQGIEILQFPINTVYINGNESSHFNPILDSVRIYSLIFKYLISSLSSFVIDIVFYSIFIAVFKITTIKYYIILSTYFAKAISCSYTFLVNKNLVFEKKGSVFSSVCKFIILCIAQSTLSGFLTNALVQYMVWNEVLSKILVDTFLFFLSFQIQSKWVFKNVSKRS